MSSPAGSNGTQALDQAGMVEGRKAGHLRHAFSNWNRWDLGIEVGRVRIRGTRSEVEPRRVAREELGKAVVRALLMNM